MNYVLFISESELKNTVPISTNVTITSPLRQIMYQAQLQYIRPIICIALYEELILQIETNTVTVLNQALLDEMKPMLAWRILYEFYPFAWEKVREQSVVQQIGNTANPISGEDLTYLRGNAKNFADRSEVEFVRWLNLNKLDYPLYKCPCPETCSCIDCGNLCGSCNCNSAGGLNGGFFVV